MSETKRKHPVRWIVLGVCLVLILGTSLVCVWQKNNIKALWLMMTADEQSLVDRQDKQESSRQEILDKYEIGDVSDYEFPEQDGELDIQTFLESTGQADAKPDTSGAAGTPDAAEPNPESNPENGQVIQQCVAALHVLENQYMNKLNGIIEETKSEYHALPEKERTKSNKLALVKSKMDVLLAAESQCDSEVEMLLQRIQQELDRQGSKSGLVSEIRQVYEDRKATWKASCLTALSK